MKGSNILCIGILMLQLVTMGCTVHAQEKERVTVRHLENNLHYRVNRDFYIVAGGGYAYGLGKSYDTGNAELNRFAKKLRSGYGAQLSLNYLFKDYWGLGLHTDFIRQKEEFPGVLSINGVGFPNYSESNNALFIGPTAVFRVENSKTAYLFDFGWGPQFYTNRFESDQATGQLSKTIFASYAGVLFQYRLSPKFGAGIKLSVSGGKFKQDLNTSEKNSISTTNVMLSGIISIKK